MKVNRLITSTEPIDQPQGSYRKAYNIILNKAKGAVTNEGGFEQLKVMGRNVIHALAIDDDRLVVFSLDNGTGLVGEIGILDKYGNYDVRIQDEVLQLQSVNPMKSIYLRNFKKELFVVWADGTSDTKILNLDNIPFALDVNKSLVNKEDVELMYMSPRYRTANIEMVKDGSSSGNLRSGVYYFTTVYELHDGSLTSPGFMMGPITITDGSKRDSFFAYDGVEPDTPTGKAIALSISNVDERYKAIRLIAIKKSNKNTSAAYVYRKVITSDAFTYVYSGDEIHEEATLEEVLVEPTIYNTAKTLTYLNNTIYKGNLTGNTQKEYNWQKYAKNIQIQYKLDTVNVDTIDGSYKDEFTILTKRGFFPDEVYAFYARLIYKSGVKSDPFHIPGPKAEDRDNIVGYSNANFSVLSKVQDIINNGAITSYRTPDNKSTNKDPLVHDVEIDPDVKFYQTRDTALLPSGTVTNGISGDNMGVWYNEDEFYSDDADIWGTDAGQPVRHHKFPSLDVFTNSIVPILDKRTISKLDKDVNNLVLYTNKDNSKGNEAYGAAVAIPIKILNGADISVQGQNFMTVETLHDHGNVGDQSLYLNTHYWNTTQTRIYQKMGEEYAPLFFLNQAKEAKTYTIEYDISWQYDYESEANYINNEFQLALQILHCRKGAKPYEPLRDDTTGGEEVRRYILDQATSLVTNEGTIRNVSGSINITVQAGDSLSLCKEFYFPPDTGNPFVTISSYFYKSDITVKPQGATQNDARTARVLGIQAINVEIPEEIAGDVLGYEIMYAKRNSSNMRVAGQSLMFGSAPHVLNFDSIGSHAGNSMTYTAQETADQGYVPFLRDDIVRFHSFDLLNEKPAVTPAFVKVGAQMQTPLNDKKYVALDPPPDPADPNAPESDWWNPDYAEVDGRLDADSGVQSHYRADFVRNMGEGLDPVSEFNRLRSVRNFRYVPADGVVGFDGETIDNSWSEECAVFKVSHPAPVPQGNVANGWLPENTDFYHHEGATENNGETGINAVYYLGTLYLHKTNVYKNMYDQEMVSTGVMHYTNGATGNFNSSTIFGGDTFFSLYGLRLTAPIFYEKKKYFSINKNEGMKNIFHFPCYTVNNANLRHSGAELRDSYYPQVGTSYSGYKNWVQRPADNQNSNQFLYSEDFTSVNDMNYAVPYDPTKEFLSEFPYRIARSKPYQPEDKEFSLRLFLANDYYEMPKHRGEIINLEAYAQALLVHLRYSLFQTASQDTLATTNTEIALGSGDIFRLPPKEVLPTDTGYLGTEHMQSCFVSKFGYLSIDSEQGKIHLFNGKFNELSKIDNRVFFEEEFKLKLVEQLEKMGYSLASIDQAHQVAGIGYTTAFDAKWDRILISKKDLLLKDDTLDLGKTFSFGDSLVLKDGVFKILNDTAYRDLTPADITAYFVDESVTVSYNGQDNNWSSFHDYVPDVMVHTRNEVFSFKSGTSYRHNASGYAKFYDGVIYPSYVDIVFNMEPNITKLFQSLQWISEITDGQRTIYDKTISQILCFNEYQCTGYRDIVPMTNSRHNEGTWSMNDFRDIVVDRNLPIILDDEPIVSNLDDNMPWYNKKRMTDKFMVTRFLYDNIDQNALYLYQFLASILKSHR